MTGSDRILIVDDEPDSVEILATVLGSAGFEVSFAENGRKALKLIAANSFDLLLLDVSLPSMDGFEILRRVRELPSGADLPVLFLTGRVDTETVLAAFAAGGQDYISKPCRAEEVLARVRIQIELKRHRERLEELVAERTARLEAKNTALREVLEHIEEEKRRLRIEVAESLQMLVMPLVVRLREDGGARKETVELLAARLHEIFTPLAGKLAPLKGKLSPQEFELATLVRSGVSSKEIAKIMNISLDTVKWHRVNIRKKLGISETGENLYDHLCDLE